VITQSGPDFGRTLDSVTVIEGLLDLCPGLHFDLAACIGQIHPYINDRQGVYYQGRHICSMDRGTIPEYKIWNVRTVVAEVPWHDADKDGVSIRFDRIWPWEDGFDDLWERASRGGDPALSITAGGRLLRLRCLKAIKAPGTVLRVGWRHTFERILQFGVPGVTRQSLSAKFGVDMLKYPVGPPDEVLAALTQE
jgi:hypothetical protein